MRILFLSYTPPLPSWGGAMTFFRHFIERNDFKTLVITNSSEMKNHDLPYQPIMISEPKWWKRISRTRLIPFVYTIECLYGDFFLSERIIKRAKSFKPDAVFTVAGSWHWTTLAAQRVAKRLEIPLIASFNDWFDYGWFPAHKLFHGIIEKRFRRFYQQADLSLVTSDGMKKELGSHRNVHVLYPTGAVMDEKYHDETEQLDLKKNNFTVFFGGSLGDWYGKMLEELINICEREYPLIKFQIFGSNPSWSESFDGWVKEKGYFKGRVTFEELKKGAAQSDLLILPMGFDDSSAIVERTSFKTKFLDYITFKKPILVWGPEYCSAIQVAREFDSAECVTSVDANAVSEKICILNWDVKRRMELVNNALKMYQDRFHPDIIHDGLVQKIEELITCNPKSYE